MKPPLIRERRERGRRGGEGGEERGEGEGRKEREAEAEVHGQGSILVKFGNYVQQNLWLWLLVCGND